MKMRMPLVIVVLVASLGAAMLPARAQVGLPVGPQIGLPDPGGVLDPLEGLARPLTREAAQTARGLLRQRERSLSTFLRRNDRFVEPDREGNPARRGELLLLDLDAAGEAALAGAGLAVAGREQIDGLGITVTRLTVPPRLTLAEAEALAARLAPAATVAPDTIHFQSGSAAGLVVGQSGAGGAAVNGVAVGMIDGAPASPPGVFPTRGFASGAPLASAHGSAVAHLLRGAGVNDLRVADVYGSDPAGGGALAIARALGWLVGGGARVVTISLVGPRNAVVERAVAAAAARGTVIVAAVGNDGPAAPPAYPASYPGVVAVTGVDGRNRALVEAGRALHLDYAAPGADLWGRDERGRRVRLRGTSYATPLVAARIAVALRGSADWRRRLDGEARDLGEPGADPVFGRGLVCAGCGRS